MDEERRPLIPRTNQTDRYDNQDTPNSTRNRSEASILAKFMRKMNRQSFIFALVLIFFAIVVLSYLVSFGLSSGRTEREFKKNLDDIRLPKHIRPVSYDLEFDTNMDKLSFEGQVNITVNVTKASRYIALHYVDLNLSGGLLFPFVSNLLSSPIVPIKNLTSLDTNKIVFQFQEALIPGLYVMYVKYSGILTDSLRGYYRSKINEDGKKPKFIATTQFEPTDARKAFPCFDEPEMKAIFNIRMTIPSHLHALSNMPIKKIVHGIEHNKNKYVFHPTVRMSTYLIAFVVSDFESISAKTKNGVDVSIWTQKDKKDQGTYALKVAVKVLEFYEKTYKVDYPLPKVDLIAIPDFAAGAMENWGLITYRDTALLFDEKLSSASDKQWVAVVIAHELAHQWFGNLVTMAWWNDLWLNEGFAQFMEYKGTNAAEPDWEMADQFVSSDVIRALHADSSVFTHPIAVSVQNPEEIQEIFDDISYGKGATVLRMLELWLNQVVGPSHFFNGLQKYLKQHQFQNAKTIELWKALDTDELGVAEMMSTWTDQPGFPVINITKIGPGLYSLNQERFFYGRLLKRKDWDILLRNTDFEGRADYVLNNNQTWTIELAFSEWSHKGIDKNVSSVTLKDKNPTQIHLKNSDGYPLFNLDHAGAYHVAYPSEVLQGLSHSLLMDSTFLPALDRAGLLVDTFALSWAGRLDSVSSLMNLTRFLEFETDVNVWKTAVQELNVMEAALSLHSSYGVFLKYQRKLLKNIVEDLGWTESHPDSKDAHLRSMLRAELLSEMIAVEDPTTVKRALDYFKDIRDKNDFKSAGQLLNVVYDTGVIHGNEDDYNWVMNAYLKATFAADQERLLHALASTRKPYLQHRTLEFAISGRVRKQDVMWLFRQVAILGGPTGPVMVWTFLRTNWHRVVKFWKGSDWTKLNEMIATLVSRFRQQSLVEEVERLFLKKEDPHWFVSPRAEISVRKGLEKAITRIYWTEKYGDELEKWLNSEMN